MLKVNNVTVHVGRFPDSAPLIHPPEALYAGVAQLVERLTCNQQVGGSNPSTSSTEVQN